MRMPNILKDVYENHRLLLYTPTKLMLEILDDAKGYGARNIQKVMKMNEPWELNFEISSHYAKIDGVLQLPNGNQVKVGINQNSCENLVRMAGNDEDFYIIKSVDVSTDSKTTLKVKCVREEIALQKLFCEPLKLIGQSPQALFEGIKSSCKACSLNYVWEGTDIDLPKNRSLITEDEQTVWDNMLSLAKLYDGFWEIKNDMEKDIKHLFLRTKPIEKGKFIKTGLNVKSLDLTYDTSNLVTRLFGYGAKNSVDDRDVNIISVNPSGKPYIENFEYFKRFLGMSDEEITKYPPCHQEATYRNTDISDPQDLLNSTIDELNKKCVPEISGNITYEDLNVFKDFAPDGREMNTDGWDLVIGEKIHVINVDIDYIFDTKLTSITKTYDGNPIPTPLEISNITPFGAYNAYTEIMDSLQKIKRTVEVGKKGEPMISDATVKDANGETVKAKIETNTNSINVIVGDVKDHQSRIGVLEGEIDLKVTADEMWSEIEMKPAKILMSVNSMKGQTDVSIEPIKGLGIYNGNITVYNKDNEVMMQANDKGSLSVREGFKITDFDGQTDVELTSKGIYFYRDGYSLRGIEIDSKSNLEFMGKCKFGNDVDVRSLSIDGEDIRDIISLMIANS